ncbi:hypothetical protein CWS35_36440 [Bradyrhizobium sp. SK17]|uniref:HdeD family acid-resistance protein n=1 Tax=Bradyrhizobium sp. SK17 TaxID=2057741 RepID=UPI000C313A2C|nr:HdeD family acid-resistance protein [Bradyrhizobium sp. SK17]AUC99126.1 hypothetical protein CWS35_36440 [Bradyrhizobium sp. SK17]
MTVQSIDDARDAISKIFRDHWQLFLVEGIVLAILGLLAAVLPLATGFAITILFGWLFLSSGIVGSITTFAMRRAPGFWWSLLSAILGIAAGAWLLVQPALGLASLTYLLIAFLLVEGGVTIMFALEHRGALSGRWEWMLVSGVVDLLLAGVVFAGLPGTIAWALGLIVGMNLVFGGASMIGMALAAHAELP